MKDSYLKRKSIEEAKYIYEDYFQVSNILEAFNTIPKYYHSTCCRCLNPYPHNENNYFKEEGFVCDDCLNNTHSFY